MKKRFLMILVMSLLLSTNAYASSIWDYLEIGMTKKQLSKLTNPFVIDAFLKYYKTDEIIPLGGYDEIGGVFGSIDCHNTEYFPKTKIEILKHHASDIEPFSLEDRSKEHHALAPIYIFENVTKQVKCNVVYNKKGNGTLKAVVFNKYDALIIADPTNTKVYEEEKKKKAAEAKRLEEEKKKKAAEAEMTTEEKEQIKMASMVDDAKSTCKELDFEEGTDRFVFWDKTYFYRSFFSHF